MLASNFLSGQPHPWHVNNVKGLKPEKEREMEKEKEEFFVDISPKFGFPLPILAELQLNEIIKRDPDIDVHNHRGSTKLCH